VLFALVLLSATYFYGIMLAHQLDKALVFLDSASALIAVLAIAVVAWAFLQTRKSRSVRLNRQTRVADLGHQGRPAPGRNSLRPLFLGQLLAAWAHL
jgi:hypothetical protein